MEVIAEHGFWVSTVGKRTRRYNVVLVHDHLQLIPVDVLDGKKAELAGEGFIACALAQENNALELTHCDRQTLVLKRFTFKVYLSRFLS
jgi:ATP adenylyltransferase/5',5'''-P-1,P-4-tetraphosphate phosphorylase II